MAIVNLGMLVYTYVYSFMQTGDIAVFNPLNPMIGPSSDVCVSPPLKSFPDLF